MKVKNPEDYKLSGFEKGKGVKKYNALLKNQKTGETKKVPFGDRRFEQYKDLIGEYSQLDHKDKKRRELYRKRHKGEDQHKFSSGYFAMKYLW